MLKFIAIFILLGLMLHYFDINVYEVVHSDRVQDFWTSINKEIETATTTIEITDTATTSVATSSQMAL